MEQDAFIPDAAVQVLYQQGTIGLRHGVFAECAGCEPDSVRLQPPDIGQMRLAGARGPDDDERGVRLVGPAIDDICRRPIGAADEKVFGLQRRAVRKVEHELPGRPGHGLSPMPRAELASIARAVPPL